MQLCACIARSCLDDAGHWLCLLALGNSFLIANLNSHMTGLRHPPALLASAACQRSSSSSSRVHSMHLSLAWCVSHCNMHVLCRQSVIMCCALQVPDSLHMTSPDSLTWCACMAAMVRITLNLCWCMNRNPGAPHRVNMRDIPGLFNL